MDCKVLQTATLPPSKVTVGGNQFVADGHEGFDPYHHHHHHHHLQHCHI